MFDISTTVGDPKFIHLATGLSVNLTACWLHFQACLYHFQACPYHFQACLNRKPACPLRLRTTHLKKVKLFGSNHKTFLLTVKTHKQFLGKKRIKCRLINKSETRSIVSILDPIPKCLNLFLFVILIIVSMFFALIL